MKIINDFYWSWNESISEKSGQIPCFQLQANMWYFQCFLIFRENGQVYRTVVRQPNHSIYMDLWGIVWSLLYKNSNSCALVATVTFRKSLQWSCEHQKVYICPVISYTTNRSRSCYVVEYCSIEDCNGTADVSKHSRGNTHAFFSPRVLGSSIHVQEVQLILILALIFFASYKFWCLPSCDRVLEQCWAWLILGWLSVLL